MMVSIVVAADENNGIGKANKLPWRLSADLKHFKKITTGHHIIMGRNTYESIGKPLPERTNIVITSNKMFSAEGIVVMPGLHEAIDFVKSKLENECMIIGGAQIYKQAISISNRIYLTRVHTVCDCDVFFPAIDQDAWKLISTIRHSADDKNEFDYSFEVYEKTTAGKSVDTDY
jgi:dihydrofolate reductase